MPAIGIYSRRKNLTSSKSSLVELHYGGARSTAIMPGQTLELPSDVQITELPEGAELYLEAALSDKYGLILGTDPVSVSVGEAVMFTLTNTGHARRTISRGLCYAKLGYKSSGEEAPEDEPESAELPAETPDTE